MERIKEIREIIQSSHLNFLIGAGLSFPFLPLLGDIETRLSKETNKEEKIKIKKEYFEKVMIPNLDIINDEIVADRKNDFKLTYDAYKDFFDLISIILMKRKSTILSKQANIFTTNIDLMIEKVIEESGLEYNDGFTGRINPVFSLSNFQKTIRKKSLHFENISEVPIFNVMKIHGSLTWGKIGDSISFSKLKQIDKTLLSKDGKEFEDLYKKIIIVNPEKKKLEETVMDIIYYELLRMYSSELEKENVVLFVMGFSMEDEHIREITIRTANSNPTLKIYIFCYSKDNDSSFKKKMQINKLRYSNIELLEPEDDEEINKLNLNKINLSVFKEIVKNMNHDNKESKH